MNNRLSISLSVLVIPFSIISGQTRIPDNSPYSEKVTDPYISVDRSSYLLSPPYNYSKPGIATYQVNVSDDGMNMLGDAANEPSIAIDPTNALRMAIGWRQFDTIASNFRQAGYAFTIDGGINWEFHGKIDSGNFRSDPVLETDNSGRFYYNSLSVSDLYSCDVFRSTDSNNWDGGTYADGGDKAWMAIDRTYGPGEGNIYTIWSSQVSSCEGNFNYSSDGGDTYENCEPLPVGFSKGTATVNYKGDLYVCGVSDEFYVARSSNAEDVIFGAEVEWDFVTPVALGYKLDFQGPNPDGLLGQVWIASDHSGGPFHGNIYLLCSVANFPDKCDVLFTQSSDGGLTWSSPVRINDDALLNWNWFGTMSVSPNSRIDVVWLDTRDNPQSYWSALYYSSSTDGGITWSQNISLSEPFDPQAGYPRQEKIGDYYHMISDAEGAHLAWAATFNGEQDVYYSRISVDEITNIGQPQANNFHQINLSQNVPNPFSTSTTIELSLYKDTRFTLDIFNSMGTKMKRLAEGDYLPGKYFFKWDGRNEMEEDVPTGVYFYYFTDQEGTGIWKKMVLSHL